MPYCNAKFCPLYSLLKIYLFALLELVKEKFMYLSTIDYFVKQDFG